MPILENFLLFFIFFCIAAVLVWALRDNRRLQKELKQTELESAKPYLKGIGRLNIFCELV